MLAALRSFESTRLASASSGSVSSAPLSAFPSQTEFRGTISLGTPSQEFRIIFDTGSHDTWIVSKDCSDEFCTATNTKSFDPAASSTYQNPNTAAPQIQYGDGTTVNGILALETITLISPSFVANNFIFTQATSVKTSVSVGEYDGLVGMSLPIGTNDPSPPLMSAILQSGSVSTTGALFGYYIAQGELTGTVTVGGIDKTLQADPASFPVWFDLDKSANMVQSGSWALPLSSLIVGNKPFAISSGGSAASVFFDTGMALGTLPQAVYDSLAAAFPSSKKMATGSGSVDYLWQVDCATAQNASSPALVIAVTGTGYQIPLYPAEYVIDLGSSTCVIGFQVSASNLVFMGNTFFKRYYTVFDYGQRKIGFVLAKGRTANGLPAPAAASTSTAGQGNGVLYGGASSPRLSRSTLAAACAAILLIGLFEAKLYR
ncbi:aspartic peptidase domain-containing protein [Zopfochytrium polystomum]|nr:aspartic peptidase domain-containing protein [Zopfochytrium polystomum]